MRQYALVALVAGGDETAARRRCVTWAEARALSLERLKFHTPQLQWLPRVCADMDNLRAVLRFGLGPAARPDDRACAARVAISLVMVWSRLSLLTEARGWFGHLRGEGVPALAGPLPAEIDPAWGTLAMSAQNIDPDGDALQALRDAHVQLGNAGPTLRVYLARYARITMHMRLGQADDMRTQAAAMQALVPPEWTALPSRHVRSVEAMLLRDEGCTAEFQLRCQHLADNLLALGARTESWPHRRGQAQATFVLDELDGACAVMRSLVDDITAAGCRHEQTTVVAMAAVVHLRQGADADALALARQAIRLLQPQGMVWWKADALPWAAWHQGRRDDALRLQAWAEGLVAARGDRRGTVFHPLRKQFHVITEGAPLPPDCRPD